ncbi:MAG: transcription antitermination factor NusB [Saprospirales bacterium]|nr:MAG: transcription antitermination factor NusB [Saprospirales bacterium]
MLSRRNVRIKVMQLLYSLSSDEKLTPSLLSQLYKKGVDKSFELLLFTLYLIMRISRISLEEDEKRKKKLLPKEEDHTFTPKLYENELIGSLESSPTLSKAIEKKGFSTRVDTDVLREIYRKFSKTEEYRSYLSSTSDNKGHMRALLDLFRYLRNSDVFTALLEDNYINFEDDKSLIVGSVKRVLKELPAKEEDFLSAHYPDDETWKDFGLNLLELTTEKDQEITDLINPVLENWDAERLATLDMILLKMALCEMLYFPSIPAKVTINEYLEVAKNYSTAKSKDFINGILDKLLSKLKANGKIVKKGRGLLD